MKKPIYYAIAKEWDDAADCYVNATIANGYADIDSCRNAVAEHMKKTDVMWTEYHKIIPGVTDLNLGVEIKL